MGGARRGVVVDVVVEDGVVEGVRRRRTAGALRRAVSNQPELGVDVVVVVAVVVSSSVTSCHVTSSCQRTPLIVVGFDAAVGATSPPP